MSVHPRGLGRGLDTLFRNTPDAPETASDSVQLPIRLLFPCSSQPRKYFDETALEELAASIRSQGIVQPLLVRPLPHTSPQAYEIVAGERRWRAARKAGLSEVPVLVRELSDEDALTAALIENLQREDLNPLEEAEAIQALKERLPLSQEELAARLGKSRPAVANALRLLQLPEDMRGALRDGLLSAGHGRALLAVNEEEARQCFFQVMVERHLSVRAAEDAADHWKKKGCFPPGLHSGSPAAQSRQRSAKPQLLVDIQNVLRQGVHPKVTVSGNEEFGRVTIPYESKEQLAALLERLGTETEKSASSHAEGAC